MNSLEDQLEQALDDGLRMTFPASDPVAVSAAGEALTGEASDDDRNTRAGADDEPQEEMERRGAPRP